MADMFSTTFSIQNSKEYEEFEKEYKQNELKHRTCSGCRYDKGQPGGMCGIASIFCINALHKPYFRSKTEILEPA